jgi:glycerol-3-phosphate dehydrogenase
MKDFEVAIIGGGVVGSSVARELSKYRLNIVVFESGSDVATGVSKANSGVVHSGINSPPGSLKARLCVEGNRLLSSLADDLSVPLKWVGKYVIAQSDKDIKELEDLRDKGIQNGIAGLEIVEGAAVRKKERNISCKAALWVPTAGIISPYQFSIALAENAAKNDVKFLLETTVTGVKKQKNRFLIHTTGGDVQSEIVVNAAGLNCRRIVAMVEPPDFQVYPCRGEYLVLDKQYQSLIQSMVYPIPRKNLGVLGVHITPTIDGNILLGPSAEFIHDPFDVKTTIERMSQIMKEAKSIIPKLSEEGVINAYAGVRCKLAPPEAGGWADFRVEESKNTAGMINLLGIESPGLTAAPAIARKVALLLSRHIELRSKADFKAKMSKRKVFSEMSKSERIAQIQRDEKWGSVVCRCEHVTEAEVIEALENPLGAHTVSSVKYRCRAGMGRCQGGFCTQHIVKIMEKYFKMAIEDITLKSSESRLFSRRTRMARR